MMIFDDIPVKPKKQKKDKKAKKDKKKAKEEPVVAEEEEEVFAPPTVAAEETRRISRSKRNEAPTRLGSSAKHRAVFKWCGYGAAREGQCRVQEHGGSQRCVVVRDDGRSSWVSGRERRRQDDATQGAGGRVGADVGRRCS